MNDLLENLLSAEAQQFIREHENDDVRQLVLQHKYIAAVPSAIVAEQISGRKKAKNKLPTWYSTEQIIYPPSLALEQCSSEATARFKSFILKNLLKDNETIGGVDLAAGYGVDSHFLSEWAEMTCVEPNPSLIEIGRHNSVCLGGRQSLFVCQDAETYLNLHNNSFDFIYLDPSRRSDGKKIFKLDDCTPNVLELLPIIRQRTPILLVKASPLLDIQQACQQLQTVTHVWVVAVENECKELLFLVGRNASDDPLRIAVNLSASGVVVSELAFHPSEERAASVTFSDPLEYLYEPGTAVMKAGAFRLVAAKFGLFKLAPDSHFYTSKDLLREFPGRIFRLKEHHKLDKKLKNAFDSGYANILVRNYPLSAREVMSRTGLREGGQEYLICTRGVGANFVMRAEKN